MDLIFFIELKQMNELYIYIYPSPWKLGEAQGCCLWMRFLVYEKTVKVKGYRRSLEWGWVTTMVIRGWRVIELGD
jgi:hypothetical protein